MIQGPNDVAQVARASWRAASASGPASAADTPSTSSGPRKTRKRHESARTTASFTRNLQSGRRPLPIQTTENKNTIRFRRREGAKIRAVLPETLKKSVKNCNFVKKIYTPIGNLYRFSRSLATQYGV